MTSQRQFSFSFPEEMDDFDFLFIRSLFLGIRHSKNIIKSDIKILVYTLFYKHGTVYTVVKRKRLYFAVSKKKLRLN